jgi:hypothetical protein
MGALIDDSGPQRGGGCGRACVGIEKRVRNTCRYGAEDNVPDAEDGGLESGGI